MRRKKNKATKKVHFESLPLIPPNAAGIDVGAKEHVVAVPCDRDPQPVRTFQAFTPDLHELAAWLKRCGIETVALESTGVYWISLYEVLEQYGFEIRVVNARHVKHVPGRTKTDVLDCQWIQKLHSFGLLNGSFRPDQQIRKLRTYLRLKDNLVVEGTQSDYWQAPSNGGVTAVPSQSDDRRGLTGSARLLQDVTRLDEYAFQTDQRKLQLTKMISLAQLDPLAFQQF